MALTKANELAEIVRHFTYDNSNAKFTTTKPIDTGRRTGKTFTASSTNAANLDTFAHASYRGAQYFIIVKAGSDYHGVGINVIHDGSNAYYNQYGDVKSSGDLATFTADISGDNVRIRITPTSASATATFQRELVDV